MTINIPQAGVWQRTIEEEEKYYTDVEAYIYRYIYTRTHVHMKIVLVLQRELLKVQFVKYCSNLSINYKTLVCL